MADRGEQPGQVVDRAAQLASSPSRGRIRLSRSRAFGCGTVGAVGAVQCSAGVVQQLFCVGGGPLGQLPGDLPYHGLGLVAALRGTQPQLRPDRPRFERVRVGAFSPTQPDRSTCPGLQEWAAAER
jgi:hypothetical protein